MGLRALQWFNCIFSDQEITISSAWLFTRGYGYGDIIGVCVRKANFSHCSVRFIVNKVEVHMWLVDSWGHFIPCWKRGKRSTDVIRQCLLVKVCQCACSSTSQGLPVSGAGLFFSVARLRGTLTPITHFSNSFFIMFSIPLGQMYQEWQFFIIKKSRNLLSPVFQKYPFLLTCEETNVFYRTCWLLFEGVCMNQWTAVIWHPLDAVFSLSSPAVVLWTPEAQIICPVSVGFDVFEFRG